MPAAKTLEQLTAKYQEFRSLGSIQSWAQLHDCRRLLQRIDQEIAQQKNAAKKEGLQLVKRELQESRKEAKERLSPETKHQRAMDDAERYNAADANALEASFKREKKADKESRKEKRIQKCGHVPRGGT